MTEVQSVLVTGATGKLGRQFVLGFASLGYDVAFTSRDAKSADTLREDCVRRGARRVVCVQADLLAEGAAPAVVEALGKEAMLPSVLVNNARNVENLKPDAAGHMSRKHWQDEFGLGVVTAYELTMAFAEAEHSPLESVVNVASIYGVGAPNLRLYERPSAQSPINYGVVKAALIHLTKELAVRLADRNIRVNAVSYGGVDGRVDDAFRKRYAELCPAGRMLQESEVFGATQFLASGQSRGISGHNVVVDGGWTAW
jgi:NAD(P)-dependent dehydrogenase (short-subunit alcohol dehydrogenase family)